MGWEQDQQLQRLLTLILQKQQQTLNAVEQINISGLQASISKLASSVAAVQLDIDNKINQLQSVQAATAQDVITIGQGVALLVTTQTNDFTSLQTQLNQILKVLIPPPAVSFIATITLDPTIQGEDNIMATKRALSATGDIVVNDDGTFTVNNTFKDGDGFNTANPAGLALTYTSSDATPGPSIFTLTPSPDTSSCAGVVNQTTAQAIAASGGTLPTGLTIPVAGTWTGLPSPLSQVANLPLDVAPGTANTFVAAVSEP